MLSTSVPRRPRPRAAAGRAPTRGRSSRRRRRPRASRPRRAARADCASARSIAGVELLGALDALGVHAERARHRRVIGELQPCADDLADAYCCWSCTSICQAPLLATTISTGARWRTAVSTSIALKPNAPSPVATTTRRSGHARLAAMPNGVPTPMQPSGPGSSISGASRPTRAKLRKSPPSATTTASVPMALLQRARAAGWDGCVPSRTDGALAIALLQLRGALHVAGAQARRPLADPTVGARLPAAATIASSVCGRGGQDLDRAAAVVAQLAGDVADAHECARRRTRRVIRRRAGSRGGARPLAPHRRRP